MASLCFALVGAASAAFGTPRFGAWRHKRGASQYWCCNAAAAANNSDASELWSKSGGYHPLEELSEKEEIEKAEGGRLSHAEIARTVAEINTNAVLLVPSLVHGNSMVGTEVAYLVDEHGEIYLELPDDNVTLHNSFVDSTCSLLIGFGDINELLTSDLLPVYDSHVVAADNATEQDVDEEDDDFFTSGETETDDDIEVSDSDLDAEDMGNPHPMLFASKLSKVATSSPLDGVYKSSTRIALTGFLQNISGEEVEYVRKKWEDRYLWEEDVQVQEEEEEEGQDEEEGEAGPILGESGCSSGEEEESWTNTEVGTSFCKFEIKRIQLGSALGSHASVGVKEFKYSEPDLLAHAASDIIQAASGKKLKRALRSLCYREKGITVEEAFIIGVDSLGVDVRASCGLELKTLRFPFLRRARCADTAQLLLHQLLYPRSRHKRSSS